MSRPPRVRIPLAGAVLLLALAGGCGDDADPNAAGARAVEEHAVPAAGAGASITIDAPLDGAVFPPGFVPPTFAWHDENEANDAWQVTFRFREGPPLHLRVPGAPPPERAIDERALGDTNEIYRPTPYQASARTWTPPVEVWAEIQRRSTEATATVEILGLVAADGGRATSVGRTRISTSKDPVGAPLLYRDVPLMPAVAEENGVIKPLSDNAIPLIEWRLRDVRKPESRLLLTDMPSCANCHSASLDGSTFGMDVDGPQGDKGTYALAPLEERVVIEYDDVITWNAFPDKPAGHKTIGFLSRVSPDGRHVVSTVNEALYVSNFTDHEFVQVFYPTRGILAWYSRETGEMKALPGADDPRYVHTNGVWTPDGETIVFSRAEACDPYRPGIPKARYPNDPNETPIRYDLYRMPFHDGEGGTPEPIEGASDNGMSNTFPKVSPDGRWIVFTKCRNGQLMRPDGKLWIVPFEGGEAREMRCNSSLMNSWHSFSPNGRWMVFSSKVDTPYTQMYLTHIDENGDDSPRILVPNSTAANRAVNIPEFVNVAYDDLLAIDVPAVRHHRFFWTGFDLLQRGRMPEAIEMLERALDLEPDWGRAHVSLGSALAQEGRVDDAMRHFRKAIQLNEDNAGAQYNLGYLLWKAHRLDEAVGHLEAAVSAWPEIPNGEKSLGFVQEARGEPERALAHFERAVRIVPDDAESRRHLADLLFAAGRPAEGLAHLEAAVKRSPGDAEAAEALAWRLATAEDAGLRDGRRAVDLARRACSKTSYRDADALATLAAAYAESGRFEDAVEMARRALEAAGDGDGEAASRIRQHLEAYQAGRPIRTR